MKRLFSALLVFILSAAMLASNVLAANDSIISSQTILNTDGSSLEITIAEVSVPTRSTNAKTGTKTYTSRNSSGSIEWIATLTASFTYNGTSASCTGASGNVSISASNWYVVSNSTSYAGNTATMTLTMGYKVLGITVSQPTYTITLSCDKDGNLS